MFGSAPATFMMSRPFHHHGHSQDEYTVAAESLLQLLAWLANGVHTRIHGGPGKPSPTSAHRLTECCHHPNDSDLTLPQPLLQPPLHLVMPLQTVRRLEHPMIFIGEDQQAALNAAPL